MADDPTAPLGHPTNPRNSDNPSEMTQPPDNPYPDPREMSHAARLGTEIRKRRKARKLTLEVLASMIGFSLQHLSEVERAQAPMSGRFVAACDLALEAGGSLLELFEAVVCERAMQRQEQSVARQREGGELCDAEYEALTNALRSGRYAGPQDPSEAGADVDESRRDLASGEADPFEPLEIVRHVERSELGPHTLEALHAVAEQLCCEYSSMQPRALIREAEQQLEYVGRVLDGRKTMSQHRELLVVSGWLSLLLGCLHNDMGNRGRAEVARDAARHLGEEAGHPVIVRWACELDCWFALNDQRFRDITRFAEAGLASLKTADSASVQLALQAAKGWAKLGDRRKTEAALQHGSSLLNQLASVERPENHFVFDPTKYEFYAAPIYAWLGEHDRSEEHCQEVFARCTAADGTTAWPMRMSDTQNTMALVQLRRGDLSGAIDYAKWALDYDRKSIPSLLNSTSDIVMALERQHPKEPVVQSFRERVMELGREYGWRPRA
jgi:transcriptional regulator with XRE-family HTH domain